MTTATAVKEHPILFSGPMVRAILKGRKTQTRRIVKFCKKHGNRKYPSLCRASGRFHYSVDFCENGPTWFPFAGSGPQRMPDERLWEYCPYGKPGERLWVRETFAYATGPSRDEEDTPENYAIIYRASWEKECPETNLDGAWKPSIHMFRWASRITLEVTQVRVERLQDISEDDVEREGAIDNCHNWDCYSGLQGHSFHPDQPCRCGDTFGAEVFQRLWESINGPGSWDANPWVWVVEFNVLEVKQ